VAPESSRDPLVAEFAARTVAAVETHSTELALLKQNQATIESRDAECRKTQAESWREVFKRMGDVERVASDLAGTVTRFINGHDKADLDSTEHRKEIAASLEASRIATAQALETARAETAASVESVRAEAQKGAEGGRGRTVMVICAVITTIGALLVAYINHSSNVTDAEMPKMIAAAVAEGVKQALAAK
jgi:hypothetical protein